MRFEGEEVKVVALGTDWVAAVTSLNYLRIFSEGGFQVCHTKLLIPLPYFFKLIHKGFQGSVC